MKKIIPELDKKGLRRFAWVFATIVAVLFGTLLPVLFGRGWPVTPWVVAGVVALWGLVSPGSIRQFYRLWMRLGFVMNAITSPVILGIVFYTVVFPSGLIVRLLSKDPMRYKWDPNVDSYRRISPAVDVSHMERPF